MSRINRILDVVLIRIVTCIIAIFISAVSVFAEEDEYICPSGWKDSFAEADVVASFKVKSVLMDGATKSLDSSDEFYFYSIRVELLDLFKSSEYYRAALQVGEFNLLYVRACSQCSAGDQPPLLKDATYLGAFTSTSNEQKVESRIFNNGIRQYNSVLSRLKTAGISVPLAIKRGCDLLKVTPRVAKDFISSLKR